MTTKITKVPDSMLKTPPDSSAPGENFLPNCQWQLWGQLGYINKMNSLGTGPSSPILVSSFQTVNGCPQLTATAGTAELKNGDIGIMGSGFQWGYAGVGYQPISGQYLTAYRVGNLVAGVSFTVQGYFNGVSPTASANTSFQPICPGDNGGGVALSASGWNQSGALVVWADDFDVNLCPGAVRVKGCRKTSAAQQTTLHFIQAKKLRKFAGRDVVFGVLVYQKVMEGASSCRAYISDTSGINYSASATGPSYVNPDASYGAFQLLTVTRRIAANPTSIEIGITFDGNSGDVVYLAMPTGKFGTSLSIKDLGQRPDEWIESIHWNPRF